MTLKDELPAFTYFRYAKGDASSAAYSEWQKSPSFTGLTADTVYTFYAKYDVGVTVLFFTGTSSGTAVRTRWERSAGYTFDVSKGFGHGEEENPQGGNLIWRRLRRLMETEDFDYTTQAVTLIGGTKAAPTAKR